VKGTPVYECESDWFVAFDQALRQLRTKKAWSQYAIKTNIIESNQPIEQLVAAFNILYAARGMQLKHVPSKETLFSNLILVITTPKEPETYHFYIKTDPGQRFWVVYNNERQEAIQKYIRLVFQAQYRQDSIYLTNSMMEHARDDAGGHPGGMSLSFKQLFFTPEMDFDDDTSEDDLDGPDELDDIDEEEPETAREGPKEVFPKPPATESSLFTPRNEAEKVKYTLRLWAGSNESYENIYTILKSANLPVNFKNLLCYFTEDAQGVVLKEEFSFMGGFTVHGGQDLDRHVRFVEGVKDSYKKRLAAVEDYRMNLSGGKGDMITLNLNHEINRTGFIQRINQFSTKFRMYFTPLYEEDGFEVYRVADLHNGDHFYAQVHDDCIHLNLHANCCGNNVLRLFTNLENYFSPGVSLIVNGEDLGA